jgi:hypothetical protein
VGDLEDTSGKVDENEYWEIIELPAGASQPLLEELQVEGLLEGLSFTSLMFKSPTIPDSATGQDFLFSIDCPLPADILNEKLLTVFP